MKWYETHYTFNLNPFMNLLSILSYCSDRWICLEFEVMFFSFRFRKKKSGAKIYYVATVNTDLTSAITNTINKDLNASIDQLNQAQQGFLSQALNGKTIGDFKNSINTTVSNAVTVNALNQINQNVSVS